MGRVSNRPPRTRACALPRIPVALFDVLAGVANRTTNDIFDLLTDVVVIAAHDESWRLLWRWWRSTVWRRSGWTARVSRRAFITIISVTVSSRNMCHRAHLYNQSRIDHPSRHRTPSSHAVCACMVWKKRHCLYGNFISIWAENRRTVHSYLPLVSSNWILQPA
jgi:hypothetical protein